MDDLYSIVGMDRNSSFNELKKAYKKMAMEFHPDRNKDTESEAIFKKKKEAFEILLAPGLREEYDRTGKKPSNVHAEAVRQDIINLFLEVVNSMGEVENLNIVDMMLNNIKIRQAQVEQGIIANLKYMLKIEKIMKRIRKKNSDNKDNIFINVLKDKIAQCTDQNLKNNDMIEHGKRLISFLEDYEFNLDDVINSSTPGLTKTTFYITTTIV